MMALPVSNQSVIIISNRLWGDIQNMAQFLTQARDLVEAGSYAKLLDIPFKNSQAQAHISFALGLGITQQIKAQLDAMTGADITIAEISDFWSSVDAMSAAIKANSHLFGVGFDGNNRVTFTSTMNATQQNQLLGLIDTTLGYLS